MFTRYVGKDDIAICPECKAKFIAVKCEHNAVETKAQRCLNCGDIVEQVISDKIRTGIVVRELRALGQAWRNDWSEFDGRQLRDQLDAIANFAVDTEAQDCNVGTDWLKKSDD